MSFHQALVSHLAASLIGVAIAGLVVRRRAWVCWSFFAYLVALFVGNRLVTHFPEQFYTHAFWTVKSVIYTCLIGLTALEIGLRTFSSFPRARRRLLAALGLVAAVTFLGVVSGSRDAGYLAVLGLLTPRGEAGALWLFVVVVAFAVWHRVPIHPFHRSLLIGFGLYLALYTGLLSLVGLRMDAWAGAYAFLAALDPLAISATVGLWSRAAWRPVREGPPIIHTLHPWAASWS